MGYMSEEVLFLHARGQSAEEIRNIDWSGNPLGHPRDWPAPLVTAVQMMLSSHFPKAITWGPDYITLFNDAFRPILGEKKDCMGASFRDIWAEVWEEIEPIAQKAYRGEATFIEDFPLIIERHGYPEQCYFTFCYSPIFDERGRVAGMMDTVIETTAKVESEKHARILNAELAHRIKNSFSIVNAIASQTFSSVADQDSLNTFSQRLFALANAHDVLKLGRSSEGSLDQTILGITAALGVSHRIERQGPDLMIGPKGASTLSLLVHELTTNAIKYGALSNETGMVKLVSSISRVGDVPTLKLVWSEAGGPQVAPPARQGFGSKLIRMGLLGSGSVKTEFAPGGFYAEFDASVPRMQGEGRFFDSN